MKIKEYRYMNVDKLRNLCIKYNWFTAATNEEYDKFLEMTQKNQDTKANMTTARLYKMACMVERYSPDEDMGIDNIMFYLADICFNFFHVEN